MDLMEGINQEEFFDEIEEVEGLFIAGEYSQAKTVIKRILKQNQTHFKAQLLLGQIYLSEDNYSKALEIFEGVKKQYPLVPDSYYMIGSIQNYLGNYGVALEEYNMALGLNQDLLEAVVGKAISLCELGDSMEALEELDKSLDKVESDEDVILIYEAKAMILLEYRKEKGRAQELAKRILEKDPNHSIALQIVSL